MAHYIFIRSTYPKAGWLLLEKVEREELAEKVLRTYQQRFSGQESATVALVEASNLLAGQALLNEQDAEALGDRFSPGTIRLPWRNKSSYL